VPAKTSLVPGGYYNAWIIMLDESGNLIAPGVAYARITVGDGDFKTAKAAKVKGR